MKSYRRLLLALPLLLIACTAQKTFPPVQLVPPVAPIIPHVYVVNGDTIRDNYYWMRDPDVKSQATLNYVNAENDYSHAILNPLHHRAERLAKEMRDRVATHEFTYPEKIDGYYYYDRTDPKLNYTILYRVPDNGHAIDPNHPDRYGRAEVVLDGNQVARGHEFFNIGETVVSPNGRYCAWNADTTGAENFTLRIRDLTTGRDLPDRLYPASGIAWGTDGQTLYFMRYVDPMEDSPTQIWKHTLGTPSTSDVVVYQEDATSMDASIYLSKNRQYLLIGSSDENAAEYRFFPANQPNAKPTVIQPRQNGLIYYPQAGADRFYILTNQNARNYKIVTAPFATPDAAHWTDFYVPGDSVYVSSFELYKDWVVVDEYRHGLPFLRVIDLHNGQQRTLPTPTGAYTAYLDGNPDFDATSFRYEYASLACPATLQEYTFATQQNVVLRPGVIRNQPKHGHYVTERIMAVARDGVRVPVSILYRDDLFHHDGKNPLYVYAYGSYGINSDPDFSPLNLALVDRGFVYAIAHIRGGREMGENWYQAGRLGEKKHTFSDYIDCTEYLVKHGYGDPHKVVAEGASAGGMLMGVVSNWRPDLFTIVLAGVPAADEFTHEQDTTLAGVAYHHQQWGDPTDPVLGKYFYSWDPYQNVKAQSYPTMFVTAGLYDSRVPYWEPAKWVAKLRAHKTNGNPILLFTETTGHSGSSGRFGIYSDYAIEYAFVFRMLGIPF